MDFNYDDDDAAVAAAGDGSDDSAADRQKERNGNERPAALETLAPPGTAAQLTNLSMPKKKSSVLGASSNLVNSIVGAGIIGIPYALRMSGLWAGILLLILVAVLTDKSLRLLIEQASFHPKLRHLPVHTFEDLASYPFGAFGSGFVLFNMFLCAYGAMVAYLLIIKDTVPTVMGFEHGTHSLERNLILVATSLLIMVPLSMQRDMASLSFTSALSVTADLFLVVFVVAYSPIKETVAANGGFGEVLKNDGINSTLFVGLGILSTAMACQHSAFIVSNSLENKTSKRWGKVTKQSITLSAILCLVLGVCGYLGFLGETQGDVLNNFPVDSLVSNAARILLAVTMFFTYPMESFVARHVLIMLVHNGDMDAKGGFTLANESRIEEEELGDEEGAVGDDGTVNTTMTTGSVIEGGGVLCMNRRQTWTIMCYLITLLPALVFQDIGPVLSLTGSVGGSCISYIGPGLVYLGVNGEDFINQVGGWLDRWRRARGYSTTHNAGVSEGDLPVEGNSSLEMPQGTGKFSYDYITSGRKPLWYYLGLFPIWTSLANSGAIHMQKKIEAATAAVTGGGAVVEEAKEELPPPSKKDFGVCLFFIVFGIVSAVAGVLSNIYVQMYAL